MRMGQGVRTGVGHGGITCVLQTQFSSFFRERNKYSRFKRTRNVRKENLGRSKKKNVARIIWDFYQAVIIYLSMHTSSKQHQTSVSLSRGKITSVFYIFPICVIKKKVSQ